MHKNFEILLGIIAALGAVFGVYQYFASRKIAKLVFEVLELSNFGLPSDFYRSLASIPAALNLRSIGNRMAENVVIQVRFLSNIQEIKVSTGVSWSIPTRESREATFMIERLNPNEAFNILFYCEKLEIPSQAILQEVKITMAEGKVIDKNSVSTFTESFLNTIAKKTFQLCQ